MDVAAAKALGAGIAVIALAGVGIGIGAADVEAVDFVFVIGEFDDEFAAGEGEVFEVAGEVGF